MIELGIARFPRREERSISSRDPFVSQLFGGIAMNNGSFVSPSIAEQVSAISACVNLISSVVASLPCYVYAVEGDARRIDTGHPLARLIQNGPNQYQDWPSFVEMVMSQVLLTGNSVSQLTFDGRGAIQEIRPVPYSYYNVQMLPNGRLIYEITQINSIYGGTGKTVRLLQDEVLHLKDRSDDGILGKSRLARAAATISTTVETSETAQSLFRRGLNPLSALKLDKTLAQDARDKIRADLNSYRAGSGNAGSFLILDQGLQFEQYPFNAETVELLKSRQFQVEEIARLYGIPLPLLQVMRDSSYNNVDSSHRQLASLTIAPWLKKLEAVFQRAVLGPSRQIQFDLSDLTRGDSKTRWEAWQIALTTGVLSKDEVRAEEGFSPAGATA